MRNPESVLYEFWNQSIDLKFVVHPNTGETKHFCLPYPTKEILSRTPTEILARLEYEIGYSISLNYFLPPAIITKAFFDDDFKKRLLKDPAEVLQTMGYPATELTCIIHENTEDTKHLTLEAAPNNIQQLRAIELRVNQLQSSCSDCHSAGGTTKCCTTGTCN